MTVTEGEASGTPEPLAWRLSYEGSQGPGRGPQHLGYRWLSRKLTAGPSSKVLPRPTRDSACRSRVCACWAGSLGTSSLMEQGSGGTEEVLAQVEGRGWTQPAVDPAHNGLQSTGQRTMEFPGAPPPPHPRSSCKHWPQSDSRNQEHSHQMQTEESQEDLPALCRGKHQPP